MSDQTASGQFNLPPTASERRHNPFDLEDYGIPWRGMVGTEDKFCVFDTDAHGLRAGFRDLYVAWSKDRRRNVAAIVTAFAPPNENDTAAYIAAVCERMSSWLSPEIGPFTPLNLDDNTQLMALGIAVIRQEQGRVIYGNADLWAALAASRT